MNKVRRIPVVSVRIILTGKSMPFYRSSARPPICTGLVTNEDCARGALSVSRFAPGGEEKMRGLRGLATSFCHAR
jgi:hypothetical protein